MSEVGKEQGREQVGKWQGPTITAIGLSEVVQQLHFAILVGHFRKKWAMHCTSMHRLGESNSISPSKSFLQESGV